jgi:hypothetical protein
MTDWNFDIESAPHGQTVKTEQMRVRSDRQVEIITEQFVPDWLWLATKCGKVLKSHWKPKDKFGGDRFIGLNRGEQPVAWQLFVIPAHPIVTDSLGIKADQPVKEDA